MTRRAQWMAGIAFAVAGAAACGDTAFNGDDDAGQNDGGSADGGSSDANKLADGSFDDVAAPDASRGPRRVLVTSAGYNGQLATVSDVFAKTDGLCAQAAFHLGDAGTFAAWIANDMMTASERGIFNPPYVSVVGNVPVFDGAGNFDSTGLVDEYGTAPPVQWWTGMKTQTGPGDTCGNWGDGGVTGSTGSAATAWYGSGEYSCVSLAGILCFEQ